MALTHNMHGHCKKKKERNGERVRKTDKVAIRGKKMTKRDNDREQTHQEYCLVNQFDKKNLTQYLAMCSQSNSIREFQNAFHLNFFVTIFVGCRTHDTSSRIQCKIHS